MNLKICDIKIDVSCEASANFNHMSQMPRLPRNVHLLRSALTVEFTKSTQHDTSDVLRLPRKMTMEVSKALRLPRKLQDCVCDTKRLSTWYETYWDVTKCHACRAKWSYATLETSKNHFCRTRHRHGHFTLTTVASKRLRTVASSCGRLQTAADTKDASSEHVSTPRPPK